MDTSMSSWSIGETECSGEIYLLSVSCEYGEKDVECHASCGYTLATIIGCPYYCCCNDWCKCLAGTNGWIYEQEEEEGTTITPKGEEEGEKL